jgi:hypothetical protein
MLKKQRGNREPQRGAPGETPGASACFMLSPIDSVLHQSPLHLLNYALVTAVLFTSVWQGFMLRVLKATLRSEGAMLREGTHHADAMLHPIAKALLKMSEAPAVWNVATLRRAVEHYEVALFVPLRAKVTLTRDLSTLMGLVATCAALVTAGAEFARHGRAELLIGSVASGTISTCVAAIGCMVSLWNGSRLTQLRVRVASEIEEWLLEPLQARELSGSAAAPTDREPATESLATPTVREAITYAI